MILKKAHYFNSGLFTGCFIYAGEKRRGGGGGGCCEFSQMEIIALPFLPLFVRIVMAF